MPDNVSVALPLNASSDAAIDAGTGADGYANEIKAFFKKGLIKLAERRCVMAQFGQDAVVIPRNNGVTYEWRWATQLTKITGAAALLTEGVTPTGSSIGFSKVTATTHQYGDFYAGTDKLDETIYDPIRAIITDAQSYQMAQVVDNLIMVGTVDACTNRFYAGGRANVASLTSADVINETEIRKIVRSFRRNSVKPLRNGKYVAVIHPDTTYTLFDDPDIREMLLNSRNINNGGNAGSMITGDIGDLWGVTFVETELGRVNTPEGGVATYHNETYDVYLTFFIGADYFGKTKLSGLNSDNIYKGLGSGGTEDPLDQRWTQGWKMTHGSQILHALYGAVLYHVNTGVGASDNTAGVAGAL